MIHVCSLAALHSTVEATKASHVLTVMGRVEQVVRPPSIARDDHCLISVDDITEEIDGFVAPAAAHMARVLDFVRGWHRRAPMVIHCYAGISRSTASAFAAVCALNPHRNEADIARQIRAASPSASPNRLMVTLADVALERDGRMVRALDAIGPGDMSVAGHPFHVALE